MTASEARQRVEIKKSMTVQSQYSRVKRAIEAAVIQMELTTILNFDLDGVVIDRLESEGYKMERMKYSTHYKISW
jgi:hypothetical protein